MSRDGQTRALRPTRALGAVQMAIGLAALLPSPRAARWLGLAQGDVEGASLYIFRLFGIRQVLLGAGTWSDVSPILHANWLIQPADLALFAHAFHRQYVPRRLSVLSLGLALSAIAALVYEHNAGGADPRTARSGKPASI